jgi:hypothetical protein
MCRSRWPRGLRRVSVAGRLLGLRVRIPPAGWWGGGWGVNFLYCQVEVSATSRSLVQGSRTECDVYEFDLGTSTTRRPWPTKAVSHEQKIKHDQI